MAFPPAGDLFCLASRGRTQAYVKQTKMPIAPARTIDIQGSTFHLAVYFGSDALRNRWGILAVLFTVRLSIAFQFQSVAAVAPLLGTKFGVSIADIGLLIGLYFTPGVALALPGGAIEKKFGDKATVLGALLLMLAGGVMMAFSTSWSAQIAGR